MKEFFNFMGDVSEQIQKSGRFGTAHVYRSTWKALREFYPRQRLFFREFTSVLLKKIEMFLRKKG